MLVFLLSATVLLVALLAIPLTLRFELSWQDDSENEIEGQWAFGLVKFRIAGGATHAHAPKRERSRAEGRKSKETSNKQRGIFKILRQQAFRRRMVRFLRALWRAIRKEDLRLRLRLGLGDPADTGRLWGLVGPVAALLGSIREASIVVEPEFFDSVFELDGSGRIRIIPLRVLGLFIALLFSPTVWRGMWQLRAAG